MFVKILAVFSTYPHKIKRNRITFALLLLVALVVLYTGIRHQQPAQALVYIFTCLCSAVIIDFLAFKWPINEIFLVKKPRKETIIFFLCLISGLTFLFFRFSGYVDWEHLNPYLKLAVVPLILGVFPVALALILFLMRYTPGALGFRVKGSWWCLPLIFLFAFAGWVVAPGRLTWDLVMAEEGSIANLIFSGLIVAGLSEEFFKTIGQTRIGALLKNSGLGWFITTLIWALMHAPKWYGEEPSVVETLLSVIRIIPLGLVWGYLTHRSKSFLPATLMHGANFWGLQNF